METGCGMLPTEMDSLYQSMFFLPLFLFPSIGSSFPPLLKGIPRVNEEMKPENEERNKRRKETKEERKKRRKKERKEGRVGFHE